MVVHLAPATMDFLNHVTERKTGLYTMRIPAAGQGCGDNRSPRIQKFTWNADGTPDFGTPVPINTLIKVPSGE